MLIRTLLMILLCSSTAWAADGQWQSDVVGVSEMQLQPDYWQQGVTNDKVLLDAEQIARFNSQMIAHNPHVVDPLGFPSSISASKLEAFIDSISSVPSSARFYEGGQQLSEDDYKVYLDNLNKGVIEASNPVRFCMVVSRASLRTFPTHDRVLNKGMDVDLDRFQETGVFPGDAVAVLHTSKDGKWYLVQQYHYLAWVRVEHIALGDKSAIAAYRDKQNFLLITGAKVNTTYVPDEPRVSELQLDMGIRLPLLDSGNIPHQLYGQNPYANYVVSLPVRNDDGSLVFLPAMVARSQDVNLGYLPFTHKTLISQAFKFLGERYGWGHDYNGRDCTGFVGEIYKTFGLIMPRNSGQQGKGRYGINYDFDKDSSEADKLAVIKNMQVGDLIYIPGHVMMYLGEADGQPYVIHDVKGLAYKKEGKLYRGTLNGVSVTPLLPLQLSAERSYVDRIYNIKTIAGR